MMFYGTKSRKIMLSKIVQKPHFNIISQTFSFFHSFIKIKYEKINIFITIFKFLQAKRQRNFLCLENDPYKRFIGTPLR